MPELFDHHTAESRAARVKETLPQTAFLVDRAAEALADRLDDVARDFPRAAIVGAAGGRMAAAMRGRAGQEQLVQIETTGPLADLAAHAAPEVETRVSPAETPDLTPGGFDLILGGLTLHRVNDPVGLLTQMRLALRPDGLLIAALFGGETLYELRAAFAEAEAEIEDGISPRVAPMGEIRDLGGLLSRAGFAMPVADVDRIRVEYETPFHLMRDLRGMGEANALAARRRTFTRRATMMRMAEIYAKTFPSPRGIIASFDIVTLTGWSPAADQPRPLRPGSAKTRLAEALGVPEISTGERAGE